MALPGKPASRSRTLQAVTLSHFIAALLERPRTKEQLREISGLGEAAVLRLIKQLRERGKTNYSTTYNDVLHIASWEPDPAGRMTRRVYALGPGVDATQPITPRHVIAARYWEKTKSKRIRKTIANEKRKLTRAAHAAIDPAVAVRSEAATDERRREQGLRDSPGGGARDALGPQAR